MMQALLGFVDGHSDTHHHHHHHHHHETPAIQIVAPTQKAVEAVGKAVEAVGKAIRSEWLLALLDGNLNSEGAELALRILAILIARSPVYANEFRETSGPLP